VRAALRDADFEVRIAAARMAGLARDRDAVPRLMEMVQKDEPPVRRQASTALGQIGDPQAVPPLLRAAGGSVDRFLEHAIIYSLITLKTPGPVAEALKSGNPGTRKAALIALDQMEGSPLQRQQNAPQLRDQNPELRRAALWVVSRHPDWSGEVMPLIRARLARGDFAPVEGEAMRQTLVSLCGNTEAQAEIAALLADRNASARQQLFLLDAIDQCAVPEFPAAWKTTLRQRLSSGDAAVRARVLALARTRQIAGLDDDLQRIAADARESKDMRIAALSVLVAAQAELSGASFQFLQDLLRPETDADLRQTASQILARARLSETQLLALATKSLPQADPLVLPNLLDAFRGSHSEQAGRAMVEGLLNSSHPVDGIAAERIPELLQTFPAPVRQAAQPLLARAAKAKESRAARLKSLEPLLHGGDAGRGRDIFFGPKAGCSSCHTIMAQGGDVGPDLTGVGAIRSGIDLLEAVVYPSASFVPGHEVYRVETAHEVYTGVQGEGTPDAVVIISGPRDRVRIPRKEIRSIRPSPVSLMPDGFADNLTPQQLSDVLAFLQAQKVRAAATVAGLR
jgi:putative heme-binding domain-containing protein